MKTFIITTKNPTLEYRMILDNWFDFSLATKIETIEIMSTIEIEPVLDQSIYNNIEFRQDGDYQFFLPEVVDSDMKSAQRTEYILDLLCIIADKFNVEKDGTYIIAHSRDLFSLEDGSGYGLSSIIRWIVPKKCICV